MQFGEQILPGAHRVVLKKLSDLRGDFVKTYARSVYAAAGVAFESGEEYYSVSHKDVVRGMHFQTPPHDHAKIVYCVAGAVEDVLLDLRQGPGFGKFVSVTLSAQSPELILAPKGIAHGFRALTDGSIMVYKTSTEYAPHNDRGIRWDSFGFDWHCAAPVVSERDRGHPAFADFQSPF